MIECQLPYERRIISSQHGEDGIIELLCQHIKSPDRRFLEIGWGTGKQNMTITLLEQGWSGVGIDKRPMSEPNRWADRFVKIDELVFPDTIVDMLTPHDILNNPDFFSLDIDSFDFDVASALLESGFRPKVVCVEINPRFGGSAVASYPYIKSKKGIKLYNKFYYGGCSLTKYQKFWNNYDYEFFTVDSSQVNAFFYNRKSCNKIDASVPRLANEFIGDGDNRMREEISQHDFWCDKIDLIYKA